MHSNALWVRSVLRIGMYGIKKCGLTLVLSQKGAGQQSNGSQGTAAQCVVALNVNGSVGQVNSVRVGFYFFTFFFVL